jgi:hypothetical protein
MEFPETCHPDTIATYHYWLKKCSGRTMPPRSNIDPAEMPKRLLPGICVVDVVSDERRYAYRLVGTGDMEVRGNDPTGKSVLEGFFGPTAEDALSCDDNVVKTRAPFLDPTLFTVPSGEWINEETLFLPLSDGGENVNKILVFSYSRTFAGIFTVPVCDAGPAGIAFRLKFASRLSQLRRWLKSAAWGQEKKRRDLTLRKEGTPANCSRRLAPGR